MSDTFRCIIAGGRDFSDYTLLESKCQYFLRNKPNVEVVSGTAKGSDKLGEVYGAYCGYKIKRFKADWDNLDVTPCVIRQTSTGKKYNACAGNIRNKEMGVYCDAAIIFWNGVSTGSKDMINIMKRLNKPYRVVKYNK